MSRRRLGSITVDVEIADVIDQIDDEDLIAEVRGRGLTVGPEVPSKPDNSSARRDTVSEADAYDEWADEVRCAARRGDMLHVNVLPARRRPFVQATHTGLMDMPAHWTTRQ